MLEGKPSAFPCGVAGLLLLFRRYRFIGIDLSSKVSCQSHPDHLPAGISYRVVQIIAHVVRAVYSFKGITRAPGMSGKLKRYVFSAHLVVAPCILIPPHTGTRKTSRGRATGCISPTTSTSAPGPTRCLFRWVSGGFMTTIRSSPRCPPVLVLLKMF